MEASFAAAALAHPIGLLVLGLAIFGAVYFGGKTSPSPARHLSRIRLLTGLGTVAVTAIAISAVGSYVPSAEAARFGVAPENYWTALWHQFAVLAVLLTYVAVLGCATVGVPVVVQLAKREIATVPIVVAASIPISLTVLVPLGLASSADSAWLAKVFIWLTGSHALFAFAFALGAGLPWRRS